MDTGITHRRRGGVAQKAERWTDPEAAVRDRPPAGLSIFQCNERDADQAGQVLLAT